MNPHPGATVSGRCAIGERPFTCNQEMPLTDGGISSKAGGRLSAAAKLRIGDAAPIPVQLNACRKRRREIWFQGWLSFLGIQPLLPSLWRLCAPRVLRRRLPLQRHFPFGFLLSSGGWIRSRQLVVAGRITGLHLYIAFESHECLGKFPSRVQRHPQRKICLHESLIKLRRTRKMPGSVVPLSGLAGHFSQHEFCRGVVGIRLEFLLKFPFGFVGLRRRRGKRYPSQAIMNSPCLRVLLQYLFVLRCRFVPVPLRFECLRFKLLGSRRSRGCCRYFFRSPRAQLRVEVRRRLEYLRLTGEFPGEDQHPLRRGCRRVTTH